MADLLLVMHPSALSERKNNKMMLHDFVAYKLMCIHTFFRISLPFRVAHKGLSVAQRYLVVVYEIRRHRFNM